MSENSAALRPEKYFRFSAVLIAVLGILASLLVGGLLMWNASLSQELRAERSSLICVRKVTLSDPVADAAADFNRGERRFYFRGHNGYVPTFTADGVPAECNGNENDRSLRRDPFPALPSRTVSGTVGPDSDPNPNACGMVIDAYIRRYNAAMARLSPQSVRRYCQ